MSSTTTNEKALDGNKSIGEMKKQLSTNGGSNGKAANKEDTILNRVLRLVEEQRLISGQFPETEKVIEFVAPGELGDLIGLELGSEPSSEDELEEIMKKAVKYSVKTCSRKFYNQLYHGVDEYGLAGAWLSEALNTNNHTFEVAPVFIVAERAVIDWTMSKFGWSTGDGIFSPGGSISNMYGMVLARHQRFPDIKTKGLQRALGTSELISFTSEESHYSVRKGAGWLGMGTESVLAVKSDARGRMRVEELERMIVEAKKEGKVPFFVNATAGTTVLGAFDPIDEIADICKKHGLWLHIDGCWGGSAILSQKHKHLLKGSEKADSIAWNPHKMIGAPLQTSPFITRHPGLLHKSNSASATYLFQQDKFYDVTYDTGDKSIQCGRKTDAFKFWFMLKARGEIALEASVDNCFAQASYLRALVEKTPGFEPRLGELVKAGQEDEDGNCTNVCFYYVPERMRNMERNDTWFDEVSTIPPKVKEVLIRKGSLMVGYQPLPHKGYKNFFRMVIHAVPAPTKADMEHVIREIEAAGKDL